MLELVQPLLLAPVRAQVQAGMYSESCRRTCSSLVVVLVQAMPELEKAQVQAKAETLGLLDSLSRSQGRARCSCNKTTSCTGDQGGQVLRCESPQLNEGWCETGK